MLLDNAARHWNVPFEELATLPGVVVHEKSGRRLTYGEIAAFAKVPATAPEITPDMLKKTSDFRLIGKDVMRVELPTKVNGTAQYSIDVQVPGMLYGAILRPPVEGGCNRQARRFRRARGRRRGRDRAAALWRRRARRDAVGRVQGQERAEGHVVAQCQGLGLFQRKGIQNLPGRAYDLSRKGVAWESKGNALGAMSKAKMVIEGEYRSDYAYHAQMEPLNSVASVSAAGDSVEIWCGTQSQTMAVTAAAKAAGVAPERVIFHGMLLGGGFGRRGNRDEEFVVDSVLLSKAVKKPVKVLWTREDDVHNGRFRPLYVNYMRAGLDESGHVVAWHHRVACDTVLALPGSRCATPSRRARTTSRCAAPSCRPTTSRTA